jgi:hypothetical protein
MWDFLTSLEHMSAGRRVVAGRRCSLRLTGACMPVLVKDASIGFQGLYSMVLGIPTGR